jgi:hypothetical protein
MKISATLATLGFLSFSGVLARHHGQCSCWVNGNYDWMLTANTCYFNYDGDIVSDPCAALTNPEG